jgi:hypothetical protein
VVELLLDLERKAGDEASKYPNLDVINMVFPLFKGNELAEVAKLTVDKILEVEGNTTDRVYPRGYATASWVFLLSPFVKHSAFQEECEWRKIVSKDSRVMPGQQYRVGKSSLIPFVEIMLDQKRRGAECVPAEKYFIDEVVIGPTPAPELTLEALRSLFDSEGHPEVIVRSSRIPFRDW